MLKHLFPLRFTCNLKELRYFYNIRVYYIISLIKPSLRLNNPKKNLSNKVDNLFATNFCYLECKRICVGGLVVVTSRKHISD